LIKILYIIFKSRSSNLKHFSYLNYLTKKKSLEFFFRHLKREPKLFGTNCLFGSTVQFPHQGKNHGRNHVYTEATYVAFWNHGNFCLGTWESCFYRTSKQAVRLIGIDGTRLNYQWTFDYYIHSTSTRCVWLGLDCFHIKYENAWQALTWHNTTQYDPT